MIQDKELIRSASRETLFMTIRPDDFNGIKPNVVSQSEVQSKIRLRQMPSACIVQSDTPTQSSSALTNCRLAPLTQPLINRLHNTFMQLKC